MLSENIIPHLLNYYWLIMLKWSQITLIKHRSDGDIMGNIKNGISKILM